MKMKVSLDTSAIVDLERGKVSIRHFIDHDVFISSVVAAEIFTGTHLRTDRRTATNKARKLLSLFEIIPLDMKIAEITGKINAYLISNGMPVDFEDSVIAATFIHKKGDVLVTNNLKHFKRIPEISDKVLTVDDFVKNI